MVGMYQEVVRQEETGHAEDAVETSPLTWSIHMLLQRRPGVGALPNYFRNPSVMLLQKGNATPMGFQ